MTALAPAKSINAEPQWTYAHDGRPDTLNVKTPPREEASPAHAPEKSYLSSGTVGPPRKTVHIKRKSTTIGRSVVSTRTRNEQKKKVDL